MKQGELFKKALQRPTWYNNMTDREQWLIDKRLGILDWDGSCEHNNGAPCKDCEELYIKRKNEQIVDKKE